MSGVHPWYFVFISAPSFRSDETSFVFPVLTAFKRVMFCVEVSFFHSFCSPALHSEKMKSCLQYFYYRIQIPDQVFHCIYYLYSKHYFLCCYYSLGKNRVSGRGVFYIGSQREISGKAIAVKFRKKEFSDSLIIQLSEAVRRG